MRFRNIVLGAALSVGLSFSAQTPETLLAEMASMKVNTALIFPSQAIDDSPVWSPDSHYLAGNVQGKWYKVQVDKVQLKPAKWHDDTIGAIIDTRIFEETTEQEVKNWTAKAPKQKDRITASMQQDGLSTALVLTSGKRKKVLWRTGIEACGETSRSSDGQFVAYICETNGIFVTALSSAINQK